MSILGGTRALQALKLWAIGGQDCALCASPSGPALVCTGCADRLIRCHSTALDDLVARPAFDAVATRFEYRFPVDRMVQRFKFAGDLAVGR
jgi:predicted amidophosphoribosyltransferase